MFFRKKFGQKMSVEMSNPTWHCQYVNSHVIVILAETKCNVNYHPKKICLKQSYLPSCSSFMGKVLRNDKADFLTFIFCILFCSV